VALTHEQLLYIESMTLWGMGSHAISRHKDDPQEVIDNLIWRLTTIRNIVEKELNRVSQT
jgi:hypothetical protein